MSKPSFYCENCGREVPPCLDVCPGCGEAFSSVRCPSCGFKGVPGFFKKGCPGCGYMGGDIKEKPRGDTKENTSVIIKKYFPVWVYRVIIGALLILIIYLLRVYFLL